MVYWGSSHYPQTKCVNQRAEWVTLSIRICDLMETWFQLPGKFFRTDFSEVSWWPLFILPFSLFYRPSPFLRNLPHFASEHSNMLGSSKNIGLYALLGVSIVFSINIFWIELKVQISQNSVLLMVVKRMLAACNTGTTQFQWLYPRKFTPHSCNSPARVCLVRGASYRWWFKHSGSSVLWPYPL